LIKRGVIPFFKKLGVPLIVSIAGETTKEFSQLAAAFDKLRGVVKAIEINLSCPNVEAGGVTGMRKQARILDAVKAVRDRTGLLTFAKLSPELGDVIEISGRVLEAGVDGLSLINTLRGMSIDLKTKTSRLARDFGGLSGPAIKPVALRYVYEIKRHFPVPVIASGGIASAEDAIEFLIAGADLVAVGTANFIRPHVTMDVVEGISAYCRRHGISHIQDLRGSLQLGLPHET